MLSTRDYYTLPFVCFTCRKSFKIGLSEFAPRFLTHEEIENATFPCPQCARRLNFVGRYFKAPRRTEVKQWQKVEELYRSGWRADGHNISARNLRDAQSYRANKLLRERTAQTKRKQELQNEKWRKMRKWPRVHLDDKSSTR